MENTPRILVADDELNLRKVLHALLSRQGFSVETVADGQEAIDALQHTHFDVVISDLKMPKVDGLKLLKYILQTIPEIPVILITAHGTVDSAVEALKLGAFDYITKPFDQEELSRTVQKAINTKNLSVKDAAHITDVSDADTSDLPRGRFGILGQSPPMQNLFQMIEKVATTPSTVLITGESGTGKELVAKALFAKSTRIEKPFIKVNCAAIPKELVESELFGYEKGAFTGAVSQKPGRFELADGGTLFLDEIGEISSEMQVKLLRVLQEGEYERVGGIRTLQVDVRLIAATNRELLQEIEAGHFREDLFYRLNVVPIHIPPLRERREDIPLLVEHFCQKFNARLSRNIDGLSPDAMAQIVSYDWPGNIRELENVMERVILFAEQKEIQLSELPIEIQNVQANPLLTRSIGAVQSTSKAIEPKTSSAGATLKEIVKESTARLERGIIARALEETGGNVTRTAQKLGISRKGLQLKMKELGLREDH